MWIEDFGSFFSHLAWLHARAGGDRRSGIVRRLPQSGHQPSNPSPFSMSNRAFATCKSDGRGSKVCASPSTDTKDRTEARPPAICLTMSARIEKLAVTESGASARARPGTATSPAVQKHGVASQKPVTSRCFLRNIPLTGSGAICIGDRTLNRKGNVLLRCQCGVPDSGRGFYL